MGGPGTMDDEVNSKHLSPLEQAIWCEKMEGASNLEIALKMFLYEAEVKQRLKMISHKLLAVPQISGGPSGDHTHSAPRPAA
jgi:DNA-binding NarL/FixJ family response regulator